MCDLVSDPATDLYATIPHGNGQTVLREALLAADHNAYHVGQLVLVRRLLGAWKGVNGQPSAISLRPNSLHVAVRSRVATGSRLLVTARCRLATPGSLFPVPYI